MATVIGIIILTIGLGFFGVEMYHLIKDIKARRNNNKNKGG